MFTACKEAVQEFVKNVHAFMIGFFSWLWDHPMWETVGEHLKSGKEMLEDGFDNARDKFAQYQTEVVEEKEAEEEKQEKEEEED